jgi:chemotaxis protein MotB
MRATTIVKILVDEGKVDPKRILAAGRGEHMPINTDNTSEGRQANRRTEIILTPQLSEILKSLE